MEDTAPDMTGNKVTYAEIIDIDRGDGVLHHGFVLSKEVRERDATKGVIKFVKQRAENRWLRRCR